MVIQYQRLRSTAVSKLPFSYYDVIWEMINFSITLKQTQKWKVILQYSWKIGSHCEDPYVKCVFGSFMFTAAKGVITFFFHELNKRIEDRNSTGEIMEYPVPKQRMNNINLAKSLNLHSLDL